MIKKRNFKIVVALMVIGILSMAGTVMAASDTSAFRIKSYLLPAGGDPLTLEDGSRTPARDCVRFTLRTSSQNISDSFPLYFRLRNTDTGTAGSVWVRFTDCPSTKDLYYINSTIHWRLKGKTDENSKYSTAITFDAIP